MKHYDIIEWADFVRRSIAAGVYEQMEQHLSTCKDCASAATVLARVAAIARLEKSFEPPAHLVAAAEAVFRPPRTHDRAAGWDDPRPFTVEITYDSARDPMPAGARSTRGGARQLLCQAEGYFVDVRFDEEPRGGQVTLVGQIMTEARPQEVLSGVPVQVMRGNKVLARALSNQFGEFCLSYTARHNLRLCVILAETGKRVELSLDAMRITS